MPQRTKRRWKDLWSTIRVGSFWQAVKLRWNEEWWCSEVLKTSIPTCDPGNEPSGKSRRCVSLSLSFSLFKSIWSHLGYLCLSLETLLRTAYCVSRYVLLYTCVGLRYKRRRFHITTAVRLFERLHTCYLLRFSLQSLVVDIVQEKWNFRRYVSVKSWNMCENLFEA